jgi:hypothetical protein
MHLPIILYLLKQRSLHQHRLRFGKVFSAIKFSPIIDGRRRYLFIVTTRNRKALANAAASLSQIVL